MTLATRTENETREKRLTRLRESLPPKHIAFCHIYASNGGNGRQAARQAGYADNMANGASLDTEASRLLRSAGVAAYLEALTEPENQRSVANALEAAEHLTRIMRGEDIATVVTKDGIVETTPSHSDKIKAAETLAKIRGYLAPIKIDVTVEIKDAGLAWVGAVLSILQARFDLSDEEIEGVLPELPSMRIGNRQEIKIIDME